jgi:hypothetical protein
MNKSVTVLGAAVAICLSAAPGHAQLTRTWVSGTGNDTNACSRTLPCSTFAGAISKTAVNGIINCLDAGGYGAVTITKSITIDCHDQSAAVLATGLTGVVINLTTSLALDPLQTVRLRNLTIDGSGACGADCGTQTGIRGINIISAKEVHVEDVFIQNFVNDGIRDARSTTGGRLYVVNSTIRDNGGSGIVVAAAPASFVNAVIERSRIHKNSNGVAVGAGNQVMVNGSLVSGNNNGVEADSGGVLSVDGSTITANGTGVLAVAGSTVRLSNNNIGFNGTAISGATTSFGNNRIYPNVGTVPTLGAASTDRSQQ